MENRAIQTFQRQHINIPTCKWKNVEWRALCGFLVPRWKSKSPHDSARCQTLMVAASILFRYRKLKSRHDLLSDTNNCMDRPWCDFVVRTDKELHVERLIIQGSVMAWCQPTKFYFSALLPELACSRHHIHAYWWDKRTICQWFIASYL